MLCCSCCSWGDVVGNDELEGCDVVNELWGGMFMEGGNWQRDRVAKIPNSITFPRTHIPPRVIFIVLCRPERGAGRAAGRLGRYRKTTHGRNSRGDVEGPEFASHQRRAKSYVGGVFLGGALMGTTHTLLMLFCSGGHAIPSSQLLLGPARGGHTFVQCRSGTSTDNDDSSTRYSSALLGEDTHSSNVVAERQQTRTILPQGTTPPCSGRA